MTRFDPARIFETLDQPIPGGTHEAGVIAAPGLMRPPLRDLAVAQARLERTEPGSGRRGDSGNAYAPGSPLLLQYWPLLHPGTRLR